MPPSGTDPTCRRGHPLDPGRFWIIRGSNGKAARSCKECHRLRAAAYRHGTFLAPPNYKKCGLRAGAEPIS